MEPQNPAAPKTLWQKAESVAFPAGAAIIGVGYTLAILVNNPIKKVFTSPHALILLAIFVGIAFFPLRTLYREFASPKPSSADPQGPGAAKQ